ncbi:hypothetical protein O181_057959 [Austropuccinia psidii MF-1]|uniref:Tf2-1-like SH3-like domain-containing protein n=1 Tax=Austropuccinia psidii MF-1 TaxID=1389203 RepID=A0A9Q3HX64_9BASI|nr:hypothetical protein [Austropuccinia psidii MF-1]
MQDKTRKHAVRCMEDSFAYDKDKWDESNATPDFKVGDLFLASTTHFNNIKGCKKLKDSFAGNFVIKALHGENSVEVELSEELHNKHATFPVSLIKPYKSSDAEIFRGIKFPKLYLLLSHLEVIKFPNFSKKEG